MTVERATRNVGWVFGLYLLRKTVRLGYLRESRQIWAFAAASILMFVSVQACFASEHSLLPLAGHSAVNVVRIGLSVLLVVLFPRRAAEATAWALLVSSLAAFSVYTWLVRRYIYRVNPFGALARSAAAAAAPVALYVFARATLNPFLLAPAMLALFAAGAFVFRCLTSKELEILRRAARSFRTHQRGEVATDADAGEEP